MHSSWLALMSSRAWRHGVSRAASHAARAPSSVSVGSTSVSAACITNSSSMSAPASPDMPAALSRSNCARDSCPIAAAARCRRTHV
eukprot:CAMPEP_0198696760 /NCGR_PEP_ID=MMETSP1468-20131203/312115_1 /TAXON_ID=1461545 /ORGANISM="Mantoniella sp, Strain CCMP1436" /LENGTH=85 /DNA_ID=CAMNT_0044453163 /DNA_START=334 /DNA_END=587 /DNA_ORIENTATION=-